MKPEDYTRAQHAVRMAAAIVSAVDLNQAIAAAEHAETVGPIVDPTLYREKGEALHQDLQLFQAAATFKAAVGLMLLVGLARGVSKGGGA